MSIFGNIMDKIFHRQQPASSAAPTATASTPASAQPAAAPATQAPAPAVDVEQVLTNLATEKGDTGNWRTSIVDLLKLLDLESSLDARKQLGQELGVHAGADGSAEQNIALQKAVWAKLAENGGIVPLSLRD